jgi:hypothetical protein
MQNQSMHTTSNLHVPFAQLPLGAKALFHIESLSVIEYHSSRPHSSMEVFADLEKIWNTAQLTRDDLKDWPRMSKLLQEQLPKPDPLEWCCIKPETQHYERRER